MKENTNISYKLLMYKLLIVLSLSLMLGFIVEDRYMYFAALSGFALFGIGICDMFLEEKINVEARSALHSLFIKDVKKEIELPRLNFNIFSALSKLVMIGFMPYAATIFYFDFLMMGGTFFNVALYKETILEIGLAGFMSESGLSLFLMFFSCGLILSLLIAKVFNAYENYFKNMWMNELSHLTNKNKQVV